MGWLYTYIMRAIRTTPVQTLSYHTFGHFSVLWSYAVLLKLGWRLVYCTFGKLSHGFWNCWLHVPLEILTRARRIADIILQLTQTVVRYELNSKNIEIKRKYWFQKGRTLRKARICMSTSHTRTERSLWTAGLISCVLMNSTRSGEVFAILRRARSE